MVGVRLVQVVTLVGAIGMPMVLLVYGEGQGLGRCGFGRLCTLLPLVPLSAAVPDTAVQALSTLLFIGLKGRCR